MGYTMKKSAILILAASSIISSSAGVQAATVTETYNFSLSNFVDISGNNIAAPYNSVTGSFTLTFDPAVAYADQTVGLTVNSFVGGPVASAFGFSTYLGTPYALSVGASTALLAIYIMAPMTSHCSCVFPTRPALEVLRCRCAPILDIRAVEILHFLRAAIRCRLTRILRGSQRRKASVLRKRRCRQRFRFSPPGLVASAC